MNPRHWNLLMFDRLASQAAPEQFAAFAIAYIDSAERLCRVLARSHRKATYERGVVVLYLTAHAVELFLKGAILRKAPLERFDHDLEHICNRYRKLYPAKRYNFEMPFGVDYGSMSKNQIKNIKTIAAPIDQLYRYPQDKDGKPWFGLFAFEPNSFLKVLTSVRASFEYLLTEYEK